MRRHLEELHTPSTRVVTWTITVRHYAETVDCYSDADAVLIALSAWPLSVVRAQGNRATLLLVPSVFFGIIYCEHFQN